MKNAGQIYFLTEADQMISLFCFIFYIKFVCHQQIVLLTIFLHQKNIA